jgi:hypothetical protein
MPTRVDGLKGRQHPCAFRFRSSHSVCATASDYVSKCRREYCGPEWLLGFLSLDKPLGAQAANALLGIASIREIMAHKPGSDDFHFGKKER